MDPATDLALATALIAALQKAYDLYNSAKTGKLTAADAIAGLGALTTDITANNTAIDAEVAEKTP